MGQGKWVQQPVVNGSSVELAVLTLLRLMWTRHEPTAGVSCTRPGTTLRKHGVGPGVGHADEPVQCHLLRHPKRCCAILHATEPPTTRARNAPRSPPCGWPSSRRLTSMPRLRASSRMAARMVARLGTCRARQGGRKIPWERPFSTRVVGSREGGGYRSGLQPPCETALD